MKSKWRSIHPAYELWAHDKKGDSKGRMALCTRETRCLPDSIRIWCFVAGHPVGNRFLFCKGWENRERMSILDPGPADTVLALTLIDHVTICNNVPLDRIAVLFAAMCKASIVEFVPKTDPKVQKLRGARRDILAEYARQHFVTGFGRLLAIKRWVPIRAAQRIMYLMESRLR